MRPGRNLTLGLPMLFAAFIVSAVALFGLAQLVDSDKGAAAGDAAEENAGGVLGGPVSITVVARNNQFDRRTITAWPGAQVTVTLDNQDAGVLHNIAFYQSRAATQPIAIGQLISGPAQTVVSFTAPTTPGNYFFRCDAHPDTMTGTFSVR